MGIEKVIVDNEIQGVLDGVAKSWLHKGCYIEAGSKFGVDTDDGRVEPHVVQEIRASGDDFVLLCLLDDQPKNVRIFIPKRHVLFYVSS